MKDEIIMMKEMENGRNGEHLIIYMIIFNLAKKKRQIVHAEKRDNFRASPRISLK